MKSYGYVVQLASGAKVLLTPQGICDGTPERLRQLDADGYLEESRISLGDAEVVVYAQRPKREVRRSGQA